ncbi:MAG: TIM barrel protein [Opitutaceae bacterium]|nr:TIM barrel protein [Opitutaceae bacterium]
MRPQLAAFPKGFMDELCVHRTLTLVQWIELAATLGVDGLEFYAGFIDDRPEALRTVRQALADHGLRMPMMCCSPDFTQPDPALLRQEVEREKRLIELTAYFGGRYCRVLSGQRRPEVSRERGLAQVTAVIQDLLPFAEQHGVVLTLENHYKDNYWKYPEFAQKAPVFVELVRRIESPWFGVNYDPSNAILAGDDPLELLAQVKHRVVTMHASDRYLADGTLEDLRREENTEGYAQRLRHGVIGRGLNDYDRIFSTLRAAGFNTWISIEDGMNGMEDLRASVAFLRAKIAEHFPA